MPSARVPLKTRTRCSVEKVDEWAGTRWREPIPEPHLWRFVERSIELGVADIAMTTTLYRCLRCDEEITEERPLRLGDERNVGVPETVVNWDGSKPVTA